jgi:hypothetical protein
VSHPIQKRFVTVEIISRGESPVELDVDTENAIVAGVHKAVASKLNLNYKDSRGTNSRHEFVGISIKEIR